LFLEGKALMDQGRVAEACVKFAASHQAEASVGALLNVARCHQAQGKIASAWSEYKEAASLADRMGQPDRKVGALEYVAELEPRLARISVRVDQPVANLEVKRGDIVLPPGSYGVAAPVDPGTYVIVASAPGYAPFTTSVTIVTEREQKEVVVPALTKAADSEASDTSDSPGLPPLAIAGVVIAGVGVISLGVGVAFGVIAIGDEKDLAAQCPNRQCAAEGLAFRDQITTKAHVSTALLAIGGAAVVGGGLMFLLAPSARGGGEDSSIAFVPVITPEVQALSVMGRF
jgi:hypothetical protein